MAKWLDPFKQNSGEIAISHGDKVDTVNTKLALSTMSPRELSILGKKEQLGCLIKQLSDYYGGDEEIFLNQYIKEVIMHHNLYLSLKCFQNLVLGIPPVKNRIFSEGKNT